MNKFLKIGTVVLVIVCLLVVSIPVSAEEIPTFSFPLSQPSCGETYGYLEILLEKSNGDLVPYVFLWSIISNYMSSEPSDVVYNLDFDVTSSKINFYSSSNYIDNPGFLYVFYISQDGSLNELSRDGADYSSCSYSFPSRSSIVGIHLYGNIDVDFIGVNSSNLDEPFSIVYSGQINTDNLLSILESINNNSGFTAETVANIEILLEELYAYLEHIDDNTTDILSILEDYLGLLENLDVPLSSVQYDIYKIYEYLDIYLTPYLIDYYSYFSSINIGINELFNLFNYSFIPLMEDYISLQENLITHTPESSGNLQDSISKNPPREDGKEIVDSIEQAQNDALGGKDSEEVKEEIKDTLDSDKLKEDLEEEEEIEFEEIELEDITVVNQNVFNVVFDAFGGKWASYVVLSLTLAFACFVIGKRY